VPKDTRWDRNLSVTWDGEGLIGHAGAVLLRKLADQAGLTAGLGSALARAAKFPLVDRGVALVSMAVAIALGATSMNDIALLEHQAAVFGRAPSDTTVRRTLELADPATLDKIARVRAKVRAHVWKLICATPAGFPWLQIAGKLLAGWLVIDLDATLITAHSDKEGAAPTFKKGYGFHPLGAWLANTAESLAMLLRPGNAGSNTFADHAAVLAAAIRQIPSRMRSRLLVRADGAGATHELIAHLLSLSSRRRTVLFTCGWSITGADVILSPSVSRGCDLRRPVADGVVDGTRAAWFRAFHGAGLLPDRVRDDRWSPSARASWRRSRALSSASCWLRWRAAVSLARSDSSVARWPAGMAVAGSRLRAPLRSLRTWSLMSGWV
jgi:hypothetical protein